MSWFLLSVRFSFPLLLAFGLTGEPGPLNRVRAANAYAAEARAAYKRSDNATAIRAYEALATLGPLSEEARMNLAHACFRAGRGAAARVAYAALSTSADLHRRAIAISQLGLLAAADEDYDRALTLLRTALRTDAGSPAIRYNYETLLRWLNQAPDNPDSPGGAPNTRRPKPKPNEQGKQERSAPKNGGNVTSPTGSGDRPGGGERPDANGQQPRQQAQGQQPGDQRGQSGDTNSNSAGSADGRVGQGTTAADEMSRRVQTNRARPTANAAIPPEQARMLLDAMRAQEAQYLQQLNRSAPRPTDPTKPDW
jgi:tetratricopeptide (TPR) repeat protein